MPGEPWLMASTQKRVKRQSKRSLYTFTEKPCSLTAEQFNRYKPAMDDSNNSLTLEERKKARNLSKLIFVLFLEAYLTLFETHFKSRLKCHSKRPGSCPRGNISEEEISQCVI